MIYLKLAGKIIKYAFQWIWEADTFISQVLKGLIIVLIMLAAMVIGGTAICCIGWVAFLCWGWLKWVLGIIGIIFFLWFIGIAWMND